MASTEEELDAIEQAELAKRWMLFSGSMDATPAMIDYTVRAVSRAIEKGWHIIVGDNHQGVDLAVTQTLMQAGYTDFTIVHLSSEKARVFQLMDGEQVKSRGQFGDYHKRDMLMVGMCDAGMFIWDGRSKGTKAAFDHAVEQGKEAFLVDFLRLDSNCKPTIRHHNPNGTQLGVSTTKPKLPPKEHQKPATTAHQDRLF